MIRPARVALAVLALAAVAGCKTEPSPEATREPLPQAKPGAAVVAPVGGKVEIVPAPVEGPVRDAVKAEVAKAKSRGRQLVVYVGARWCEPCMHFHEAAAAGELDARFPKLTLLEFDLDRDRDRLVEAGYVSRMIPLLWLPNADGSPGAEHMEGSVKGDGAVGEMAPRLDALLARVQLAP